MAGDDEAGPDLPVANTKVQMFNIFMLGLCFFLVFAGFNTMGQTQALIYSSADSTGEIPGFSVNGLVTNGIVYGVFAFASWIAPSIVVMTGPRICMIIAALTYLFNITQLLYLNEYSVYPASVILGIGAPIIWVGQGAFLANNSNPKTVTRNSGIFWAMNMSSAFAGNSFAYFLFKDTEFVEKSTRMLLGGVLSATTALGIACMFLLRPTPWVVKKNEDTFMSVLKSSWTMILTKRMLLFSITLFFTGLNQAFWGGVYATCVGFTEGIGADRKALAGLSGVIVAAGEVAGGLLFGFFGHLTVKRGRHPIIFLGFVMTMIAYSLMLINFPMDASAGETSDTGFINPSRGLALGTAFILGFGDACFMTQVTAMLAELWSENPASAFGIFKFVQGLASMLGFLFAGVKVGLYWQLLIAAIFCLSGTIFSIKTELEHRREKKEEKEETK